MFKRLFNHKQMLADQVRMEAYRKAIHEVVKKGDVVVDIGTGSGILSFFALEVGAEKVYAIEQDRIIEEARKLAGINGLEERIVFIEGRSDRVELPEKVDVVSSEILGPLGLEEHAVSFKIDARKRFLKPGGKLIPSWLDLYLIPVASEEIWSDHIGLWKDNYYGFDFSPVRKYSVSRRYITDCSSKTLPLALPSMISHVDFYEVEKRPFQFEGSFLIEKKGPFHGFVGYFRSGLSPGVVLSTSPEDPPTHWMQTFFPMEDVVMVEEGDEVLFKIKALPLKNTLFWEWGTRIHRNETDIRVFDQSDLDLSKSELLVGRMDFRPVLTEKGEIFRRVLQLCGGKRSMEEISELIWTEYPETYANLEGAFQEVIGIVRPMVKVE